MESLDSDVLAYGDTLYPICLLQNIEGMRAARILCDIVLVVDKMEIMAHKVILAAASPYFQAMFCLEMKEAKQDKIDLHDIEYDILEDVVNFFYTAKININDDNVYALMEVADLFQVSTLRKNCSHYLESTLTPCNCLSTYVRAGMRDYPELEHAAFRYALHNFSLVLREEEFLHIPVNSLLTVLSSRLLNVKEEGEILEGILRWIKYDPSTRLAHIDALISKLHLISVSMEVLLAVKTDADVADTSLPGLINRAISAVLEERYENGDVQAAWLSRYSSRMPARLRNQRYSKEQEVLLAIGGESIGMALCNAECFTLGYDKWKCVIPTEVGDDMTGEETRVIPTMKHARSCVAVASTDYLAYVIGGKNATQTLDAVECYNVQTNVWRELRRLPVPVQGAGAAFVGRRLYVAGGLSSDGYQDKVWAYEEAQDVWRESVPMSRRRGFLGVASSGGALYAAGGVDPEGNHLMSMERYDPVVRRWHTVAPMREPRARAGCVALDGYIYVLGGYDGTFWLKSVERYNTLTNEWSYVAPMSVPRSELSATVCDKRIYCLGGHDSIHYLDSVEKYNPRTNRWHCVTNMRHRRYALGSATLHVPLNISSPL